MLFGESDEIEAALVGQDFQIPNNQKNEESDKACRYLLELHVEMPGVIYEPSNRIIFPLSSKTQLTYKFNIFPTAEHLKKGTLWVNLIFQEELDQNLEKIPLFAIPLTIQMRLFLGIAAQQARILLLVFIVINSAFLILLTRFQKKPK